MTNITNEQLEAWAGLGPWRQEHMHTGGFDIFDPLDRDIVTIYGGGIGLDKIGPYAALIAAAPALAAALLAERKAREVLEKALNEIASATRVSLDGVVVFESSYEFAQRLQDIAEQALKGPTP